MESTTDTHADVEATHQEKEATIQACIKEIVAANEPEAVIAGFDILHKLISNILKNP